MGLIERANDVKFRCPFIGSLEVLHTAEERRVARVLVLVVCVVFLYNVASRPRFTGGAGSRLTYFSIPLGWPKGQAIIY